ncbi:MAG: hypothetical protein H6735_28350 [Alphaproteobacteria bacterium]|nr:hypothetical protein [Alphaproteobacteria bacterium]
MWLWVVACAGGHSGGTTPAPTTSSVEEERWVVGRSSYFDGRLILSDRRTGEVVARIDGLDGTQTVVTGPDGRWVACAELQNRIVVIDPATLEIVGALVEDDPETAVDETGGLIHPDAAIFGPDGRLYVSSFGTDEVLRYEPDGTFVDVFVGAREGGLRGPDLGLAFDADGRFYAPGWTSDAVHRYDADGHYLDDVVGAADGLDRPRVVAFDHDGRLYVTSRGNGAVLRRELDGTVTRWIERPNVTGMIVDEAAGQLLLTNDDDGRVEVRDLASGELLETWGPKVDGATALSLLAMPPG